MKLGKFINNYLYLTDVRIYDADAETELYSGKAEDTPLSLSQRKISFMSPKYDENIGVVLDIVLAESDDRQAPVQSMPFIPDKNEVCVGYP